MTNITDYFPTVTADNFFTPSMMKYDGSTGHYSDITVSTSGNKVTGVFRFKRASFTGGGAEFIAAGKGSTDKIGLGIIVYASDFSTAGRQSKCLVVSSDTGGVNLCRLISINGVCDGNLHTIFYSFDGDTGVATFIIDGVDADDTGNGERTAPTTGTLETGASSRFDVGNLGSSNLFGGDIGFVGYADTYLTNWSDFMDSTGNPLPIDESTWTEWGGQPLFWNAYGDMENNLGSAGAMTRNGTIVVSDDGTTGSSYTLSGTAVESDIKAGKTAWVNGKRLDGTYEPPIPQGGRIFDDASQLYKSYTSSGNKLTVFLTLTGVVPNASNRRIFRVESPSGYSNLSIEVYASGSGIPNRPYVYQVNSSNTGILGAGGGYSVGDEGRYSIFFSSDRDLGVYTYAINGVQLYTASYNDIGTQQTGANTYIRFGSISGSQYLRCCIGSMMVAEQYMTNWEDFMDVYGNPQTLDTSGWTEWGGSQPLVYAPNGDLDTNNLGSLGAFTWSP